MNDFLSEYGLNLITVGDRLSWREFRIRLDGLLDSDSRLRRRLEKEKEGS